MATTHVAPEGRIPRTSTWISRVARLVLVGLFAAALLSLAGGPASAQEVAGFDGFNDRFAEERIGRVAPDSAATTFTPPSPDIPEVGIKVDSQDATLSRTVVVLLLLTVGSVAPGLLLLTTTFTRFVVVLGLAKNALGVQTVPPSQVLVGLALFLSFFVMHPVFGQVNEQAIQPMLAGDISSTEAFDAGFEPLKEFMLAQTRDRDLQLFVDLQQGPRPETREDVSAATLIPAFVISELRTAFVIGFVIFIPFLVLDLVVSAVLMSMGMMMLPPVFISLPLKLLLFILVDGWVLIAGSLVNSVNAVG